MQSLKFEAPLTVGAQIEARAAHPATADKVLLLQGERKWTYRRYRDESVRTAHFLLGRLGRIDDERPGHVAMLMENQLELLSLYGGCAYAGLTLFGANTGLHGEVLASVLNHSRARLLVAEQKFAPEVERIRGLLRHIPPENIFILHTGKEEIPPGTDLVKCIEAEAGAAGSSLEAPAVTVTPDLVLMVIYTSGTTALPKGIKNDHLKMCAVGMGVSATMGLTAEDVGYTCMPLFHSNSMFVGFMPAFWAGGGVAVRERFSARGFVTDICRYGVTFWNYVGEPVHYVLAAIEREYGDDEARIAAEITNNPRNKLRYAIGNGASAPDIDRFSRWFGLEDMFELYGSTEAAISTFRRRGDPRGSVGEVTDPAVKILRASGEECPPAEPDADGRLCNYEECVGEICRVAADTGLFQGYYDDPGANAAKYRDGIYHSGDLGHILVRDGKRYLFFDGRTDDWIRKDGENFSAAQVGRVLTEHPDVALAVAYGVPCLASDELVMAALKLAPGKTFRPQAFFDWCETQVRDGSMDRKWIPDFVRVVDDFDYTETQKVLVRNLKRVHFDRRQLCGEPIYWRQRGDRTFRAFSGEDYEAMRRNFARAEKLDLLDR